MIYSLRRNFILISAVSMSLVFAVIFGAIFAVSTAEMNKTMDMLTDVISGNGGRFPRVEDIQSPPMPGGFRPGNPISPDTPFSTRFFTVETDAAGRIVQTDTERISSVSREEAENYARQALAGGDARGWISHYRYKIYGTGDAHAVVFVNGEAQRGTVYRLLYLVFAVMAGSFVIILLLIVLISGRAVKPAAESYEKQKQFVTDANHELKTPLTLILSNVDIVEAEIGPNEWLDDIRSEGERMGLLINQLVTLSRMDEDTANLAVAPFDFSAMAEDAAGEFAGIIAERGKHLTVDVEPGISYSGDEGLIRKLMSVLLDNAVKYCDEEGEIAVRVHRRGAYPAVTVENTYADVDSVELGRLFDRFYRADRARTFTGSFGVGLSVAKSIAKNHRGDITAYKKDARHIGFRVILK